MPNGDEYEVSDEIQEDIQDVIDPYGTSTDMIETAGMDPDVMAYLGTSPEGVSRMLASLGITDPAEYGEFIDTYDPWKEQMARDKYAVGRKDLQATTKADLLQQVGKPVDLSRAGLTGFEGIGGAGGYSEMLENVDASGAANKFSRMMEGLGIDRAEAIRGAQSDWAEQFYDTAGDIYAQQNMPKGGGKK